MARLFSFRFETMLKIRRQREDQLKQVVANRIGQINQVQREMEGMTRQIEEHIDAMRISQGAGRIDLQQAIWRRNFMSHLHKAILEAEARVRGMESQLVRERAEFNEARKQRRILEKLKQRQYEKHQVEMARRETQATDDQNMARYIYDRKGCLDIV